LSVNEASAISIQQFGGINHTHTRQPGESSNGQNFVIKNGALRTREGVELVSGTPFTNEISSVHSVTTASYHPILVSEGANLWHTRDLGFEWTKLKDGTLTGNKPYSTVYQDYLLLATGPYVYAYEISSGALSFLIDEEGGDVPSMEFVAVWRGRIWGWAPHYTYPNKLWFNGYVDDEDYTLGYSKDSWPADFYLNVTGNSGEPIISCTPFGTHLYILTRSRAFRLYGYDEDDFEYSDAGAVGVYDVFCTATVGDAIMWLGPDKKVYEYTGTSAVSVSASIDEFLEDEIYTHVWVHNTGNQFWLVFPHVSTGITNAYVYDRDEEAWYIFVYPTVLKCACAYSSFLSTPETYFGTDDYTLVRTDDGLSTDLGEAITTEFYIGPLTLNNRAAKYRHLLLEGEARNDFDIDVYTHADESNEANPVTISFNDDFSSEAVTKKVYLEGLRGRNIYLRFNTTDKICELHSMTLPVLLKGLR